MARQAGALVIERTDTSRRGKAYALEFGIRHLQQDPPDVLVVIDADCQVEANTVSLISQQASATGRPVQCLNLCEAEPNPDPLQAVSALGFRFKNLVRPAGLARLGSPCQLMGTGMALPWSLVDALPAAGDNLVEDMQMDIELSLAGHTTLFCPETRITSRLPNKKSAFVSQRTRWEHGHLRTTFTQIPRLLLAAVRRRQVSLLAIVLDLTVPPFSLLMVLCLVATVVFAVAWELGASPLPVLLMICGGLAVAASVLAGWAAYCRHVIPFSTLASIPLYIVSKLPIYISFFFGRRRQEWIRTERHVESQ